MGIINSLLSSIPNIIWAIIFLVIAIIVSKTAQNLVTKLLTSLKAEERLAKLGVKDAETGTAIGFLGKLAYFVVFLLFLPSVLDRLGMSNISSPISSMVQSFLHMIPKLVAAGLIIAIGLFLARVIKQLLIPVLKALKVDSIQEKAGIEVTENTKISSIIANFIYGVIILIVITSALEIVGITAISAPATTIVSAIFSEIPFVLAAIIIIAVGVIISNLVAKLLTSLLAGIGTDKLTQKILGESAGKASLSKIIGEVVRYVLLVIFFVEGLNALKLPILATVGNSIIAYLPSVLAVVLIVAAGLFVANTAETAIVKKYPAAKGIALTVKIVIYILLGFISLTQLGVATSIVQSAFVLLLAAIAVAFAIAFGIGGKKFAENTLTKLEKKIDDNN